MISFAYRAVVVVRNDFDSKQRLGLRRRFQTFDFHVRAHGNRGVSANNRSAKRCREFVGGKDIVMIVGNPIPDTNPVQLELMTGGKVLTRCWFNWEGAKDVAADKSILFNYPTNYTATAVVSKTQVTPTPGTLEEGQMPEQITK